LIRKASPLLAIALLASFSSAGAQQQQPKSFLSKQLDRIDLGVSAAGVFNGTVSGPIVPPNATNYCTYLNGTAQNCGHNTVSDVISNTVGEDVSIRYVVSPYKGFEFNFVNARYTENFSTPPFGVQTGAREFTFGYVATPKTTVLGFQPFVSVGTGTTQFKPTPHGGQGLPDQYRMTYYYSVGLQQDFSPHFGARIAFRQTFLLAPDFGQNYLTILQHTSQYEPTAGFYLRF